MPQPGFSRFAWFFVCYLIAVILFGAWVRISGSGNGCGNHWPMCNGEVIPQAAQAKTIIEFSHRVTRGLCGILGIVLVVWARRVSPAVFRASLAAMFFLIVESLIGAVLVKKELVAGDASMSRAIVISLHLANTMLLTASAATVAWWATARAPIGRISISRGLLAACLLALLITNMSGAVTALGDTLFPIQPTVDGNLLAKLRGDLSPSQHFLVRLRIIHPIVAAGCAALVLVVFFGLNRQVRAVPFQRLLELGQIAILAQVCVGAMNVALAAPGWMQIVHLLVAQVVWILAWLVMLPVWRANQSSPEGDSISPASVWRKRAAGAPSSAR